MPKSLVCLSRPGGTGLSALCALLFTATPALASSSAWFARPWQTDDGLPDNSIAGVAQTPDGYLWVGTDGGLMRFDGARFQEFSLVNLEGVPNRVIRAMVLDHRGRLWLGMDRGPVVCLAPDAAQVFTVQDGLPDARASMIVEDGAGAIWIAYASGAVSRIQDAKVTLFTSKDGLAASGPSSLAVDTKGQLWFARGRRVGVFRDGKFHTLANFSETSIRLAQGLTGGVWVCADLRLLKYEEGGRPELRAQLPAGTEPHDARVLLEDRTGAVWIGTATHGLFRFDGSKIEPVQTSYPEIGCLMEGSEGNIWVGTRGGGLDRLRPRTIELLGTEAGLPFESIRSVCEDGTAAIWAATWNGQLARWQDGTWVTVSKQTNWPGGQANCVTSDRQGAVWIGTRGGLYRWSDGAYKTWRRRDGLASDNIRSLLASSAGDIWIATDGPGRLQRLHEGEWRLFDMPQRARSIRAMTEDAAGNIWMASAEGLLWRVSGDMVENETPESSGRQLSIRCLHATADGSLWIGYAGWGLGRLKAGHLTRITDAQGLHDNYISQIVADERGSLWFAGNHGVFAVALEELGKVCEGRATRVRSLLYGQGEGLPNLQANYENSPGALRARDGHIWFPMRTGLAVVHGENIRDNPVPPPVLVERVAADGQTVALYDSRSPVREPGRPAGLVDLRPPNARLRLGPDHRKLEFEFTALSFTAPANVRFRYRLENFDEDWIEADTRRIASYPRLPAGDYRFRVMACNNAGVWNEAGRTIRFVVTPFFWQTWWFRVPTLAAFTLCVIGIVRYVSFRRLRLQLRQLEQQAALHKERARIAKDIHDDLGANLTQISLLGELAQQDRATPEKAAERTERISATARQAIKSLDEIVWAVNPRNDTLAHLIDYSGQFALDYLRLAGIRCRLDFPEQPPAREVSTDVRHNLFLAIKEALNNVVKHAQATEVWLRVNSNNGALEFCVEDNGRGFERAPDDALADGLRNMRQRLAEVGGDCSVASQPGTGTKVTLRVPWPRN